MERSDQRQLQYVGLATVCAVVYNAITGRVPDPRRPDELDAVLNAVAHALSGTVPIFAPDPGSAVPRRLSPFYLAEGSFSRGAQVFTSRTGEEQRGLTVQRRDMLAAIAIFRSANISFPRPGSP